LIFRAFQCKMELDYITVSRLLLIPVAKGLLKPYELVSVNLSQFTFAVVLHSAALCIRLRNILRKWFVTSFNSTHMSCNRPATSGGAIGQLLPLTNFTKRMYFLSTAIGHIILPPKKYCSQRRDDRPGKSTSFETLKSGWVSSASSSSIQARLSKRKRVSLILS